MKSTIEVALVITIALLGGSLSLPAVAADNVTVGVGSGGIAFGYSDGYWDRGHNWHGWKNNDETAQFRTENRDHYYDRKHDAEKDSGWRDSDRYWDQH